MDILTPWSFSTYYPLNGFHPLYRSLGGFQAPDTRILVPRKPACDRLRTLLEQGFFEAPPGPAARFTESPGTPSQLTHSGSIPEWFVGPECKTILHEFLESVNPDELRIQSTLPGAVELHHTAPATQGDRPFVLHCEAFGRIFFPFLQRPEQLEDAEQVNKVRMCYRRLFESRNCLIIASHLSETLSQISHFFQSTEIDKKLMHSPIGLDPAYIAEHIEKPHTTTHFIFLNSAHQMPASFALRGGVASLKLAINLLRDRSDVRFYFRTSRPRDEVLSSSNIDLPELRRFEGTHIFWIEHYLPQQILNRLIAKCHFMLVPSANLHSVSIMSGLANGAIPIVTDTFGTDLYVEDMVNGAILRGIRAEIWTKDDARRITYESRDRFLKMQDTVTTLLIAKVRALLSSPQNISKMARAARYSVQQRFGGNVFAGHLVDEIHRRTTQITASISGRSSGAGRDSLIEELSPAHFDGPPRPIECVRLPNGSAYRTGRNFVFLPREKYAEFSRAQDWSPLHIAYQECFSYGSPVIFSRTLRECLYKACNVEPDTVLSPLDRLKHRAAVALHPYPMLTAIIRGAYRAAKHFGNIL